MATIGIHLGHDAAVALTDAGGFRVIEAERRVGMRHVCGGNAEVAGSVADWAAELSAAATTPVTRIAVADWYTPVCPVLPPALVDLVNLDARWSAPGGDLADAVLRPISAEGWPVVLPAAATAPRPPGGPGARAAAGAAPELVAVRHHYAHAALAYYASGATKALVVALDGTGGYAESGMVCLGDGEQLTPVLSFNNRTGPRFGLIAEGLARRIHGSQFHTGKLMGLAATGEALRGVLPILRAMLVPQHARRTDPDLFAPLDDLWLAGTALRYEDDWWEFDPESGGYLDAGLADSSDDDVVHSYATVFPDAFRTAEGEVVEVGHGPYERNCRDLAATFQAAFELDLVGLITGLGRRYPGYRALCYAGSCALNINANTALVESGHFSGVYVPTCSDDSGVALGAALAAADPADRPHLTGLGLVWPALAYAGPPLALPGAGVRKAGELAGHVVRTLPGKQELIEEAARLLAEQQAVAWLEGDLETGPRGLGHRVLLVSPHWQGSRLHLSRNVKGREWYHPAAPVCPEELADQYFTGPLDHTDTMLFAARVRDDRAELLSQARHIDGTARVQTVRADVQPALHRLCHAVGERTGLPVLISASANDNGRPILNDLDEALDLLAGTELGAVVLPEHHTIIEAREPRG